MTLASSDSAPLLPMPAHGYDEIVIRLEEAGRTLLALPMTGPSTRLVQSGMEWVRDASQMEAPSRTRIRPAVPPAADITRMDEALAWIPLIPTDKYVLRRVVGARSLVSPMTGRYLFSWRRLGVAIGADHKAVQRWHAQGILLIQAALRRTAPRGPAVRAPLRYAAPGRESGPDGQTRLAQPCGHGRGAQA